MWFETVDDPAEFLERAGPLLSDEARHNLILGIVRTLITSPEVYPDRHLFLVGDGEESLSAAVITAPYNLIVSDTPDPEALATLVAEVSAGPVEVPGAIGNQPTIDRLVMEWERATGDRGRLQMAQGVFALTEVTSVTGGPGRARPGVPADQDLIERMMAQFLAEALPEEEQDDARLRKTIARRLSGEGPNAYWLWEDAGEVVSWTGHGNPTGRGIRIGPVYTPPRFRGHGYATALVAAQSKWLLDNGYDFCFLYTDLANPTSNAIYERIGYQRVGESAVYAFAPRPES